MKHIFFFLFISSVAISNAQTQRIKDLLPKSVDINASQYSKEQETRNSQANRNAYYANEDVLLYLNDQPYKANEAKQELNKLNSVNITCMQVITNPEKVAEFTKDPKIRKVLLIETQK
jgi:hypothetical protein